MNCGLGAETDKEAPKKAATRQAVETEAGAEQINDQKGRSQEDNDSKTRHAIKQHAT